MFQSNKHINAIRKIALALPEAEEGTSCNKLAFKSGKKGFLYVGENEDGSYNTKFKLVDSLQEAQRLAGKQPKIYSAGSNGWVDAEFPAGKAPPAGSMERWIEESFRALVPKKIVAQLGEGTVKTSTVKKKAARKAAKKTTAKKTAGKKKTAKKNPARK